MFSIRISVLLQVCSLKVILRIKEKTLYVKQFQQTKCWIDRKFSQKIISFHSHNYLFMFKSGIFRCYLTIKRVVGINNYLSKLTLRCIIMYFAEIKLQLYYYKAYNRKNTFFTLHDFFCQKYIFFKYKFCAYVLSNTSKNMGSQYKNSKDKCLTGNKLTFTFVISIGDGGRL